MSVNLLSSVSTALPSATFNAHGHGHRRGGLAESIAAGASAATGNGSRIGDLPVGVSAGLFSSLVRSLAETAQANASSFVAPAQTPSNEHLRSLQGKATPASSALGNRVNVSA